VERDELGRERDHAEREQWEVPDERHQGRVYVCGSSDPDAPAGL
jgi:hypothetical protein